MKTRDFILINEVQGNKSVEIRSKMSKELSGYLSRHDKVVPDNVHHSIICKDAGDEPRPEPRREVGH